MPRMILGEFTRTLDERYRLSLPAELAEQLTSDSGECVLAKERPGCLSLWSKRNWQSRLDQGIRLVETKIEARRLEGRLEEVQRLGRLLSTRHRDVQLAGRSRLVVPEGFREFLAVEPASTVIVVGAAVCIEIWHPECWSQYVGEQMPGFRHLLEDLSS